MFVIITLCFKIGDTDRGEHIACYHRKTVFSFPVLQPYVFKVIFSDIAVAIVDIFSINVLF